MRSPLVRLAVLALIAVVPGGAKDLAAQTRAPDPLCWRGRPLDRCKSFLLLEFSAPRHLAGTRLDPIVAEQGYGHPRWDQGLASQFMFDVGYMRNVGPRSAVGGTVEVGFVVDDPRTVGMFGATARYRRWLTRRVSADGAVGVLRMPVGVVEPLPFGDHLPQRVSVRRPALTADARLGFGDLLGVTGRAMVANDGRGRTHGALFAGVSIGSTVTAVTAGAYAALMAYLLTHVSGDDVTLTALR
jgi:hypothetical protein